MFKHVRCFRIFLLLLATASAPATAVVNGTVDSAATFLLRPVGSFDANALAPACNGVSDSNFLIAPNWVLTSGTCLATQLGFPYVVDTDLCGGAHGTVSESFTYPNSNISLLHLDTACDLRFMSPFVLNDAAAPAVGTKLYDTGWGGGERRTGTTTVAVKDGLATDEVAFTGANLFCSGSGDDGGPHWDYGSNGFPVVYAIFDHSDATCTQYDVSKRMDALISFITSHASGVCLRSNPTGPSCDGLFRNGLEPPLN